MPTEKASPPRLMRFDESPDAPHDDEGDEEGERQGDQHHQRGAQLRHEEEEDEDHEEAALQQGVAHRSGCRPR